MLFRPWLRLEHRPLTTSVLHRVLSWANLPKVAQVWPQFLIWDSTPLLQEFLGRPLFLLPWGFQRSACRVMLLAGFLRMWPIHLHFLFEIWVMIGSSPANSHSISFVTLSVQPNIVMLYHKTPGWISCQSNHLLFISKRTSEKNSKYSCLYRKLIFWNLFCK